ncbi:class II fructose-bisphosphatase [Vibrio breoganii]|uniref:class II fructose-bisphosphatase n=1 Tax=Vibrio breoganii TaxID=553239 RepID=UPI000C82F695|nr:class II fructose-bisphosphatase [Vibrio breoganii]PMG86221.1 fructose-bisphosphatase, class II [Vibrio breoganii]PMK47709.1 fructose-bisphosphatase, class II [Vibrio breoganii]PMO29637.1 fructose-bisphosphatase, class II [Vibrio breoganii]
MKPELSIAFSQVTEGAALAGYKWLGRGDKNSADKSAVEAMRYLLNNTSIDGKIVIGEGEIDEAPMLYIGEELGLGGSAVDIAVDPIEGTRMTAMGQSNAIAVLAAGEKGSFLEAPDMYMEKLVVGPKAKGCIDLHLPLQENLHNVAKALNKELEELVVVTLAKPRHETVIREMQQQGIRVYAFPDGDVAASILTCMPDSDIDLMYCVGGAPEGIVTAAVMKALDGDMHGRLLPRHQVKEQSDDNIRHGNIEIKRCIEMGVEPNQVLALNDMVKSDNVIFSATGITKGDLLDGVYRDGDLITTETLLIQGKNRTIRKIKSTHDIKHLDANLAELVC